MSEEGNISEFLFALSKFKFNFEHLKKKDDLPGLDVFEFTDSEKSG